MFNATRIQKQSHQDDINERIRVSLKTLIDLAKPAAGLSLHRLSIRAQQSGGYLSRIKGRGMEFDETRLYQHGDDIRSIDWRVTARTGKTHTKLFREEREKPVFISVDNRPTMHFATRGVFKSVQAKKLGALLAWAASHQGDRIGGQLFSNNFCQEIKPQNGKNSVLHFLNLLVSPARDAANKATTLEQTFSRLSQHVRPGSLVYIISDFRGFTEQAANYLVKLSEHNDVVLIFVYDALEQGFSAEGRFRFTDTHKDTVIDTADKARLAVYQNRFTERLNQLKRLASRSGLALIQISTQDDPVLRLRRPLASN
jgi:uncharacterized protein (DUF58 family)